MSTCRLLIGDVRETLHKIPDASVQCVVTSPPYWGLRDYGHAGQLGLEPTPEEYVANMVDVFREVRRVLRSDGTCWLNFGDSYCADVRKGRAHMGEGKNSAHNTWLNRQPDGLKPKDLVGIPWRTAFALQADGWWLRSDIIWAKPNPMPESVTDRPTKAHEYLFLLAKSERYYYDADAIAEPSETGDPRRPYGSDGAWAMDGRNKMGAGAGSVRVTDASTRNARTVWTITTKPFPGAHFATFPPELAERCILAGSAPGDTVLDPFAGSGTTGMVATGHGRRAVLCELNPDYEPLIVERVGPMLMEVA